MENCMHVARARARARLTRGIRVWKRGRNTLLLIPTKLNSAEAFGAKPRDRAVLCKRFEIRTRQVEINREIGAVLIKPELNGISPIPPQLIELAEQQ